MKPTDPSNDCGFDLAIVGGGLGGLSLSILMARQGFRVALFEKETYPFHRVCGEYISMESYDFLQHLGVDLQEAPRIQRLQVISPKGKILSAPLALGGFGISRYRLDHQLAQIAVQAGVELFEGTKVDSLQFQAEAGGQVQIKSRKGIFRSRLAVCAHGKKSNLDVKLDRDFARNKPNADQNYVGVKYHVHHPDFPADLIELANFPDGYCGMSQIEEGKFCMCYLTTAANLQRFKGSISEMEESLLKSNPILKERLESATRLFDQPVTVSNVNFQAKAAVEDHLLMLGDAAGSIAPLAGNGMSMGLHGAFMLHRLASAFLTGKMDRNELETRYAQDWSQRFQFRIKAGSRLQGIFGKAGLTEMAIGTLKHLPYLTQRLIRMTHGKPFFPAH